MTPEEELIELREFRATVEPRIQRMYDLLFFDDSIQAFDPHKDWDIDTLEEVAGNLIDIYGAPKRGTKNYPKIKGT